MFDVKFVFVVLMVLKVRIFVTERYDVRDAPLYRQSVSAMELDVSQANIPTNFKATFKFKQNVRQGSMASVGIGADSNNYIHFGKVGSWEVMGIYIINNGQTVQNVNQYDAYSVSEWVNAEFTYNNGVCTLTTGNTTKTLTNSSVTLRDYLKVNLTGCDMSDLLIMPL